MSRAKTVCLTFRDFLNGPVQFQVPEGYRRLQLNHFSVTWSYGGMKAVRDLQNTILGLGVQVKNVFMLEVLLGKKQIFGDALKKKLDMINSSVQEVVTNTKPKESKEAKAREGEEGDDDDEFVPPDIIVPPLFSVETDPFKTEGGIVDVDGFWKVNPAYINIPYDQRYLQIPGLPLYFPWISEEPFQFGDTMLKQKAYLQLRYAKVIPHFVQLSCTGLGAWNDIISVCTYPGHEPNMGMQGNTYEIINPSLTFTVLDDNLRAINNVTLVVQFTLL